MIRLEGLDRIQARLQRMATLSKPAAVQAMNDCADHVHTVMVTQFLNGQAIGKVHHALATQWHVRTFQEPPAAVLGTGVPYAHAQEYGASDDVFVKSHHRRPGLRRRIVRGGRRESDRSYKRRKTAWQEGKGSKGAVFSIEVQGHPRTLKLRERKFLRGAIDVSRPALRQIVLLAWRRVIDAD